MYVLVLYIFISMLISAGNILALGPGGKLSDYVREFIFVLVVWPVLIGMVLGWKKMA